MRVYDSLECQSAVNPPQEGAGLCCPFIRSDVVNASAVLGFSLKSWQTFKAHSLDSRLQLTLLIVYKISEQTNRLFEYKFEKC